MKKDVVSVLHVTGRGVGDKMRKKEKFEGNVEGIALYDRTDVIPTKKFAELTGGHAMELRLKGEDLDITLNLNFTESKLFGRCMVEATIG